MSDAVAEWLRRHPEWAHAQVEELDGGRSHRAWRLSRDGRAGVLKLDGEPRHWPGNSRSDEAFVQRRAAGAGLASPVGWHSAEGILTGWLDGVVLDAAALRDERVLRAVGTAVRDLHTLPPVGRHFDLAGWSEHYRGVLGASGRLDQAASDACDRLRGMSLPGPYVLSHNDLVPANIVAGECVRFLDWEYAADNSWLFDLAALHVEAALDADATRALFEAYAGDASVPPAFIDAVTAYQLLSALWEASTLPAVS